MTTQAQKLQLRITHLAGLGDGVAEYEGKAVFVPYSCAGELVEVELPATGGNDVTEASSRLRKPAMHKPNLQTPAGQRADTTRPDTTRPDTRRPDAPRLNASRPDTSRAQLLRVLESSPDRSTPPCRHYGACGGCNLQHLTSAAYAAFKRDIAHHAARQLGMEPAKVAPLFQAGAASRRRAEVKLAVHKGEVTLGFMGARSHQVLDTPDCQVVEPVIADAIRQWKRLLEQLKKPSSIHALHMTAVDNGLDIMLILSAPLKSSDADRLRDFAIEQPIARLLSQQPDGSIQSLIAGEAMLNMGDALLHLPAGAFLQATRPSQQAMVDAVLQHCAGYDVVADLYCGCGTFTLPLAQAGHRILAYEGGADAVTALFNAARRTGHESQVSSHVRDLYARPLTHELDGVDAVVINPPRNGALPQCKQLATSAARTIVMVSCNPATFIRDGKALCAGGYRLHHLLPIDQFTWSHHLELVGVFRR